MSLGPRIFLLFLAVPQCISQLLSIFFQNAGMTLPDTLQAFVNTLLERLWRVSATADRKSTCLATTVSMSQPRHAIVVWSGSSLMCSLIILVNAVSSAMIVTLHFPAMLNRGVSLTDLAS